MKDKNIVKIVQNSIPLGKRNYTYKSNLTQAQLSDNLWEWDLITLLRLIKPDAFEVAYNDFILRVRKIEDIRLRNPQNELSILHDFIKEIESELHLFDGLTYYCQTPITQILEENSSFAKALSLNSSIIDTYSTENYWIIKKLSIVVIPHVIKLHSAVKDKVGSFKLMILIQEFLIAVSSGSKFSNFRINKLATKLLMVNYDSRKLLALSETIGQLPELNKIVFGIARAYMVTNLYYVSIDQYNELVRIYNLREKAFKSIYSRKQKEEITNNDSSTIFDECTENQIVLTFYFFFKGNKLEMRSIMDVSSIARFLHLLTNKNLTTLQKSEIYEKLRKAPNYNSDRQLIKDLNKISPFFEKYGLKVCLDEIEKEKQRCLAEIDKKIEI